MRQREGARNSFSGRKPMYLLVDLLVPIACDQFIRPECLGKIALWCNGAIRRCNTANAPRRLPSEHSRTCLIVARQNGRELSVKRPVIWACGVWAARNTTWEVTMKRRVSLIGSASAVAAVSGQPALSQSPPVPGQPWFHTCLARSIFSVNLVRCRLSGISVNVAPKRCVSIMLS